MPFRFEAAILREIRTPLIVEEIQAHCLSEGQVLVQMSYAGICRSQLMEIQGLRGADFWLPHLLGHEGSGIVLEVGDGVSKVVVGDQVVIGWVKGTGISAAGPCYVDSAGKKVNAGPATTFSTKTIISEDRIYLAPDGFTSDFLSLFGCALLTGGGMVINHFDQETHRNILILGFGGVGSSASVVLESFKTTNLVIVDESAARREQARLMGFRNVFSLNDSKFIELSNLLHGFDLCVESAGSVKTIESGFSLLNKTGKLVFASHPEFGAKISLDPFELINGKTIVGSFGGGVQPDRDIEIIAALLLKSQLDLSHLLGKVFSLKDINIAIQYLENAEAGRPLLRMLGDSND